MPSLTETLSHARPDLLVGATVWCTHPAELDVERVRGTKNPHVARIIELAPDLVVANRAGTDCVSVATASYTTSSTQRW